MQPTSAQRPPKKGSGREQASSRAVSSSRLSQSIDDSGEGRSQSSKRPRQPTTAAPRQRVPVETGEKAVNRAKAAARACVTAKPAAAVAKTVKSAAAKSRKLRETTRRTASEGSATPADAAAGTAGDRASTSADASCSGVSSALRSARRKRAAENEVSTELFVPLAQVARSPTRRSRSAAIGLARRAPLLSEGHWTSGSRSLASRCSRAPELRWLAGSQRASSK